MCILTLKGTSSRKDSRDMVAQPDKTRTKLPSTLRPFFWDYDFRKLSWQSDRDLIVGRILTEGDWDSIMWLRREVGDDSIRTWIQEHHRALSPKQLRFWESILKLSHRKVNSWLAAKHDGVWEKRHG